jgi:hypothetical protein
MGRVVCVELLLAPDCSNAAAARAVLIHCLTRLGLPIGVRERVGAYASPTILVDGVDVMTGGIGVPARPACRLDIPTESELLAALRARCSGLSKSSAGCPTMDASDDQRRRRP